VESGFDSSPLLARWYTLSGEMRVRLRLAQVRDAPAIRALFERGGLEPDELELARLVRFDPRRRLVICASTLLDASETILGVAATQLERQEPDLLFVDGAAGEELRELLSRALLSRARAIADRRAA
jgi:hypothetical protein